MLETLSFIGISLICLWLVAFGIVFLCNLCETMIGAMIVAGGVMVLLLTCLLQLIGE
jgi:hypothetical protein